eukprot:g60356.t1
MSKRQRSPALPSRKSHESIQKSFRRFKKVRQQEHHQQGKWLKQFARLQARAASSQQQQQPSAAALQPPRKRRRRQRAQEVAEAAEVEATGEATLQKGQEEAKQEWERTVRHPEQEEGEHNKKSRELQTSVTSHAIVAGQRGRQRLADIQRAATRRKQEQEKARKAKEEARLNRERRLEQSQARRLAIRQHLTSRTHRGQPIMKNHMTVLLEKLQRRAHDGP